MADETNVSHERMLEALELFYYSHRFRNSIFIIALEDAKHLAEIQLELKILNTSHIEVVLVVPDGGNLQSELEVWNRRGDSFSFLPIEWRDKMPKVQKKRILEVVQSGGLPVCGVKASLLKNVLADLDRYAFTLADVLDARKVFLIGSSGSLRVDGKQLSHPTPDELEQILESGIELSHERSRLQAIIERVYDLDVDTVLLGVEAGKLFEEIFTHRGAGTLITESFPNEIRVAQGDDVLDLLMLLKPNITSGAILPVSEDEIAQKIEDYYVYTVNGVIVASAMLKDFKNASELARVTTLPRYQGRGRAKKLLLALIEQARKEGKEYVFSVSVESVMWQFIEGLGFHEVDRKTLPAEWLKNYDLGRPSKAYRLDL